jgi:hypothetical protein
MYQPFWLCGTPGCMFGARARRIHCERCQAAVDGHEGFYESWENEHLRVHGMSERHAVALMKEYAA